MRILEPVYGETPCLCSGFRFYQTHLTEKLASGCSTVVIAILRSVTTTVASLSMLGTVFLFIVRNQPHEPFLKRKSNQG